MEQEPEAYRPWYKDQTHTYCPFQLVKDINPHHTNRTPSPDFRTLAIFPWTNESLSTLWDGALNTEEFTPNWRKMIAEYWDAVAVGSDLGLYVFFTHMRRKRPLCVRLPMDDQELIEADVMSVAWSLSHNAPFEPVIIFSRGSVTFIYSLVREGMAGYVRGHGGAVTSIAVHPKTTHLFSTTSRDHSTRIYDLNLPTLTSSSKSKSKKNQTKEAKAFNPHWPPSMGAMSFAGASHGLHLRPSEKEDEGRGLGRCIAVLMGGRSGGHNAAVLGAAFHPIFPIIATCGMDRCVKIWAVRPTSPVEIKREDKPLFSSSRIHKARVLSVAWLQDDLLLTHSASAIMRRYPNDSSNKECYLEPGELIIWRWLGVDRFFPPTYEETPQSVLRGCSSDYQESASFRLISIYRFPAMPDQYTVPLLNLFQTPTHDPVVTLVYPGEKDGEGGGGEFWMVNLAHLEPKGKPVFPLDSEKEKGKTKEAIGVPTTKRRTKKGRRMRALVDAAQGLSMVQDAEGEGGNVEEVDDGNVYADDPDTDEGSSSDGGIDKTPMLNGREEIELPELKGWKISIGGGEEEEGDGEQYEDERRRPRLINCALGMGGRVIVGVGSGSGLWVWNLNLGLRREPS